MYVVRSCIENLVFTAFGPDQLQMNKQQFVRAAAAEIRQYLMKSKVRAGFDSYSKPDDQEQAKFLEDNSTALQSLPADDSGNYENGFNRK